MSVNLFRNGGLEPPTTTELKTTSATTICAGLSTNLMVVETIILVNVDTSAACLVTLEWVDAASASYKFWQGEIPAKSTVIIDSIPLLVDGKGPVRSIKATAAMAGKIWATVLTSVPQRMASAN